MIEFRKTFGGDAAMPVEDLVIDSTYAASAKKNDLVKSSGGVITALTATDANVLGMYEGPTLQHPTETTKKGKIRTNPLALYEVSYVGGTPNVGLSYGVSVASDGTYQMNVADTTHTILKVHELLENGNAMVGLNKASTIL